MLIHSSIGMGNPPRRLIFLSLLSWVGGWGGGCSGITVAISRRSPGINSFCLLRSLCDFSARRKEGGKEVLRAWEFWGCCVEVVVWQPYFIYGEGEPIGSLQEEARHTGLYPPFLSPALKTHYSQSPFLKETPPYTFPYSPTHNSHLPLSVAQQSSINR